MNNFRICSGSSWKITNESCYRKKSIEPSRQKVLLYCVLHEPLRIENTVNNTVN